MTGAFLHVERKGKWENTEVEYLTKAELEEIIGSRDKAEIMDWLHMMCSTLRLCDVAFSGEVKLIDEEENEEGNLDE